jgi:hypothetical protein
MMFSLTGMARTGTCKRLLLPCRRPLSSNSSSKTINIKNNSINKSNEQSSPSPSFVIHKRGDHPYGSREYLLMPAHVGSMSLHDKVLEDAGKVAGLFAHRNIVFGAYTVDPHAVLAEVCQPLLHMALMDASGPGEQAQALATLHGLCQWVQECMEGKKTSKALHVLKEENNIAYEACRAIAYGVPRPGHSVLGVGTFRDGKDGWDVLAKEFIQLKLSPECQLYESSGFEAQLVGIDHLADTRPAYVKSAGGAMARYFFV